MSPTPASRAGGPPAVLPADLLDAALRRSPATPLLTAYDDATDERVELSAATLANWVAKTANLLQDECDVGPGSTVAVDLPVHWQTAAILLGAWSCGAAVLDTALEVDGRVTGAEVVLVAQDRLPAPEEMPDPEDGGNLWGVSLHPLGLGLAGYTGPARDFAVEVRAHGDVFSPYQAADPTDPGLLVGEASLTLASLVTAAGELAGRLGLTDGDRVLVDERTAAEAGPVAWLLAPLAAGASLVLCRNAAPDRLAGRAAAEHVTATLGTRIEGVRELGRTT